MSRRKINYHEHDTPGDKMYPDISNVASANECTGLMYKAPVNPAEHEAYQELSPMEIPKGEPKTKVYPMRCDNSCVPTHLQRSSSGRSETEK